jgi:hypothetical protein
LARRKRSAAEDVLLALAKYAFAAVVAVVVGVAMYGLVVQTLPAP